MTSRRRQLRGQLRRPRPAGGRRCVGLDSQIATRSRLPVLSRRVSGPKGRHRQERGLVDKTVFPEPDRDPLLHSPDDCPDCIETRDDPIQITPRDRVITRLQMHGHLLVDFALVQQRHTDEDGWQTVVEADCRHDEVHVHWYNAQGDRCGRQVLRRINTQQDVEDGYDAANALMFDQWDDNVRRRTDGR